MKHFYVISALFFAVLCVIPCGCANPAPVSAPAAVKPIVIDAGHGLPDSGAKGINGTPEQSINLSISKMLCTCLCDMGYGCKLTRTDEYAIAADKKGDMALRRRLIEGGLIAVSIHQNSFPGDPGASGPQVFYCKGSEDGKRLAKLIQTSLNDAVQPEKPREALPGDYFIVKSGSCPSVIVECGFLSNRDEERLLTGSQYQVTLACAIAKGTADFLKDYFPKNTDKEAV